jgi:phospholipid-binding lipoprotein MlaA
VTLMNWQKNNIIALTVTTVFALSGCATATLKEADQSDPWLDWNKSTQAFNESFDKHILKPVAKEYLHVTKGVVDDGVTNFFSNVNDIGVTINDVLQFKLLQSGMDFSRFLINTTVGLGGVFDWASKIDLPKHHEDFGQTLGVWGVPSGPYLVLPFFGSSTPRDTVGLIGDALMDPITYVSIFGGFVGTAVSAGTSALDVTDYRAGIMTTEKVVNEASNGNRYEFIKNSYLQHREFLITDGKSGENNDPLDAIESGNTESTGNSSSNNNKGGNSGTKSTKPNNLPALKDKAGHHLELDAP